MFSESVNSISNRSQGHPVMRCGKPGSRDDPTSFDVVALLFRAEGVLAWTIHEGLGKIRVAICEAGWARPAQPMDHSIGKTGIPKMIAQLECIARRTPRRGRDDDQ
jgi:hypothetical protein